MQKIIDRFISYVTIDTESDPNSDTTPSTAKQWDLANKLVDELKAMGMQDVTIDENAYIMATLPSNVEHEVPTIGFVSHFDTTPDFTGKDVKPQIIENYDGKDIVLNKEQNIVLSPNYFEDLLLYKGQTLITTDGSQIGELEYENFNAAGAKITFKGKSVHPGYAKGKMINSMLLASQFIARLPENEVPERTTGYEGFFHVHHLNGSIEESTVELIIRDHDKDKFEARKKLIYEIADEFNKEYLNQFGENICEAVIKDQYYNMKEKVTPVFHIVEIAEKAMKELGIEPLIKPIRGGTDGSQLSYKGLPCPNIFAGGHNFHGKYEYVPVESMVKATEVIVKIAELTAKK